MDVQEAFVWRRRIAAAIAAFQAAAHGASAVSSARAGAGLLLVSLLAAIAVCALAAAWWLLRDTGRRGAHVMALAAALALGLVMLTQWGGDALAPLFALAFAPFTLLPFLAAAWLGWDPRPAAAPGSAPYARPARAPPAAPGSLRARRGVAAAFCFVVAAFVFLSLVMSGASTLRVAITIGVSLLLVTFGALMLVRRTRVAARGVAVLGGLGMLGALVSDGLDGMAAAAMLGTLTAFVTWLGWAVEA